MKTEIPADSCDPLVLQIFRFAHPNTRTASPVSNVEVNKQLTSSWISIDTTATYTIVTNAFIAAGHNGYSALKDQGYDHNEM